MDVQGSAEHPRRNPSVMLNGTAKEGSAGPPIGLTDIGVSEDSYLFRVALPGIRKDESNLKCDIQRDGVVQIQGIMTEGGIVKDSSSVYKMMVQQLGPPGPFAISFKLPGPVDPRLFSPNFRSDGILEVVVMKWRIPTMPAEGVFPTE